MNVKILTDIFGDQIRDITSFRDEITVTVDKGAVLSLCRFLKDSEDFALNFLSDLCGVDRFPTSPRFRVVYHLYSTIHHHRLRVKIDLEAADPVIESVVSVWQTADWHERECYDMFGIRFRNHPDLQRILMPDDCKGYPLRKDFPLEGY
jgi:NADH-quinone oxidoreductase subunit C